MLDEMHLTNIMCVFSHSVMSNSLQPHELHQASLSMEFSGQEYWSKWPYPTPGIFPTQGPNPQLSHLLHWWQILYHCATWEAPTDIWRTFHMIAAEYTYFSSIRGTFPRIDNMVDHK